MFGLDGYMSIFVCDFVVSDMYFFVYIGDCFIFEGFNLVVQNDNGCGEGLLIFSLDSIEVIGGEIYYIEWIDCWMDGFGDEFYIWEFGFDVFVGVEQDEVFKQSFIVFLNLVLDVLNIWLE